MSARNNGARSAAPEWTLEWAREWIMERILKWIPRWIATLAAPALMLAAGGVVAQDIKGDPEAGSRKNGMCIGCHAIEGYRASYPEVYTVPKINGQTPRYIELALTAYRNGDRDHPTMRAIAGSLTDQDIADLAAHYGRALESR